jgi:PmbA protein
MTNKEDFAQSLISKAKKYGATAADVVMSEATEISASMHSGKLDTIEQSENSGFGLRVFVGNKSAIISSSRFDEADNLAERAVSMAKQAPADEFAELAPKNLLATEIQDLDIFDANEPDSKEFARLAGEVESIALAQKGITNSDGADAGYGKYLTTLATSDGFFHQHRSTRFSLSVSVLAGNNTDMERDYDFSSSRHFADLKQPEIIAKNAAARALARLNPRKVKSGVYPIIFEPRISNDIVSDLASGINGAGIARGTSFLKSKMEEQIFHESINIVDDPHILRGMASKPFDAEGVQNNKLKIIENGVLKTWLLDVRSANQLKLITNGRAARGASSPPSPTCTNLYMQAGTLSPKELIADIKQGFYVTETSGMGVNYTNGDYSVGASGFWIENGVITFPVNELTLAGNLLDMFKKITPANDLEFTYSINAPTLRIEGMTVAGL